MPNGQADVAAGAPNPESYTDDKDGTVLDNITQLMWQQTGPTTKYTWEEAVAYCPTLSLGGHTDWRLPSRIELMSLVEPGSSSPNINGTYFPGTPLGSFWSISLVTDQEASGAWAVGFYNGGTFNAEVTDSNYVRCLRPAYSAPLPPPKRYLVNSSAGTVFDNRTNLTWEVDKTSSSTAYAWTAAIASCSKLGTGWRLPTVKELLTIVDQSQIGPALNQTAFPSPSAMGFWSSSVSAAGISAYEVDFGIGMAYADPVTNTHLARCVSP